MNYKNLANELAHKERSVKDLIDYIKTRASDTTPNYSLLLGAGASFTSKIRTGTQLVNTWRQEIYEKLSGKNDYDESAAKEYLSTHEGAWYSQANEYSSLFEKKFDLPLQRRRFVEQEVDNKIPSIGYSYLVSLTNTTNRYFDTIFTTNFDDLINEAFYQFSQTRPVVCAHDSSINSISVSSTRPKIIKLHGDYLFDDIKSTLRETESLETNIKKKLIEFSKEYGLIVVGYAGNDRSIMDVLSHLLKTDEYLKNGVYWCLRKDDYINPELRKLLWKDRVYFVNIDGFDELMAEIHNGLNRELSLKDGFIDSKKDSIVNFYTKDEFSLCKNSVLIRNDIEKLKKHKNDQDISDLIRELSDKSNGNDHNNVSETDFKNLLSIDSLIKNKNFPSAKEQCEAYIADCSDDDIKSQYIKKLISINVELKQQQTALELCDRLIETDEFNAFHAISKARVYKTASEQCKYIASILSKYEHNYFFQNFLVSCALNDHSFSQSTPVFDINSMLNALDKSLRLEPSLDNPAWLMKLDVLELKYEGSLDKKLKEEKLSLASGFKKRASEINSNHITYFKLKTHPFVIDSYNEALSTAEELTTLYSVSQKSKKKKLLNITCNLYSRFEDLPDNSNYKSKIADFLNSEIIKNLKESNKIASLNILKAKYYLNVERNINKCKSSIDDAMHSESAEKYTHKIINILCDVFHEYVKAEEFLNRFKPELSTPSFENQMSTINLSKGDYDQAILNIETAFEEGFNFEAYIHRKSYILLKAKKFEQALTFSKMHLEAIKSPESKDVLRIHIELAKKLSNQKIDDICVRNIISRKYSKSLVICAECLLDHEVVASRLIKEAIDNNYMSLYDFKEWPAIPDNYLDQYLTSDENLIKHAI